MNKKYRIKKAQSTLEYAALIAIVVCALIAMQAYLKRSMQSKMKSSTDQIGDQYSPFGTTGKVHTTEHSNVSTTRTEQQSKVVTRKNQVLTVDKNLKVDKLEDEKW